MQHSLPSYLDLETSAPSPSTRLLELSPLALNIRLLVLMRAHAKVLDGLSRILGTSQQYYVRASRVLHGQLVDRHAGASSLLNADASCGCETQGSDVQLRDGEEAVVVCNGAHNTDRLVGIRFLGGFAGDL